MFKPPAFALGLVDAVNRLGCLLSQHAFLVVSTPKYPVRIIHDHLSEIPNSGLKMSKIFFKITRA